MRVTLSEDQPSFESFAAAMQAFGPFEPAPDIAVGVSGGADSMALAIMLDRWVKAVGGRLTALTVDHGLRAEAAKEARQVGRWMAARGISHQVMRWKRDGDAAGVSQEAAREARYALLQGWCRDHGVLHLCVAHHADDQAETVLLRFAKGSGPRGLAGMAASRPLEHVRLLRPLLGVRKAALSAFCRTQKQPFIEDPSNRALHFARPRLRAVSDALAKEGLTVETLLATAAKMAAARHGLETSMASLFAAAVSVSPQGYAVLDLAAFGKGRLHDRQEVLASVLTAIGGGRFAPPAARLSAALEKLGTPTGRGFTLAGCKLDRLGDGRLLICCESARAAERIALDMTPTGMWDRRFEIAAPASAAAFSIAKVGQEGWVQLKREGRIPAQLPRSVVLSLPGLWQDQRIVGLPSIAACAGVTARFRPVRALSAAPFDAVGGIVRPVDRHISLSVRENPEMAGHRSEEQASLLGLALSDGQSAAWDAESDEVSR